MSKKSHKDGEQKLGAEVLRALLGWLDANGLRRVALVGPLGASQMQISRIFAGTGYLSAAQRRAIEKFTEGALTVAMLEGKARLPTRMGPKQRVAGSAVAVGADPGSGAKEAAAAGPVPPRPQTAEEAERMVDDLTARAMPAAFRVILEQMVKGKSESERRRCAEILIEHLRGKAKQYEKREALVQPVEDAALLRKLEEIETNLTGKQREEVS